MSDFKHIAWLLGNAIKLYWNGDISGAREALFFVRLHLYCESCRVDEVTDDKDYSGDK